MAKISRPDCSVSVIPGQTGPNFQARMARMSKADWFGYPGKVYSATPGGLKMDYVKQVSTYQILNEMKIASFLQKAFEFFFFSVNII